MGIIKNIIYNISNKRMISFFKKQTIYPYYHIVSNKKVDHIKNLYEFKNENQFRNDIDFLLKHYKPINSLEELRNKNTTNSFLISFDDGLGEVYSTIFPILKEKNIKALFFINPQFIDNESSLYKHNISLIINHLEKISYKESVLQKIADILKLDYTSNPDFITKFRNTKFSDRDKIREVIEFLNIDIKKYLRNQNVYLTKNQIREMIDCGMFFGGHTMTHPPLSQLNHDEVKNEIIDSIHWVKSNFKIDYSIFAFPFTDKNISKRIYNELFEFDNNILIFGNSGLKKDFDKRIIQRFSLENPNKTIAKTIISENLYKIYNKIIGKYKIKRK